jgi:RHS repeat-associated protein
MASEVAASIPPSTVQPMVWRAWAPAPVSIWHMVGNKSYELDNHLGNMMVTITDARIPVRKGSGPSAKLDHYLPTITSAQDYYAFGMLQPGRQYTLSGDSTYRYGFNGKENDNEVKGLGNEQDYGNRIYYPRVGRFLSTDPIFRQYPELSSYQFASNRPIDGLDLDGLEFVKKANGDIYYAPPKPGNGSASDAMTANGQISATIYNQAQNETTIRTVNFQEIGKNTFRAAEAVTKVNGNLRAQSVEKGEKIVLKNGGKVNVTDFSPKANSKEEYGTMTGMKIALTFSPKNSTKAIGQILYLQAIKDPDNKETYDSSSGSTPFYFYQYANRGYFSDNPAYKSTLGSTQTFTASLVIYLKEGNTYKAVGQLDYSFDVKFDKNKKGSVENIHGKFTDLSEKRK